jgi:V-type H+-transporting ATPase subunit H
MPPYRNGSLNALNGKLPSLDNLNEEDVLELADSLVKSKERRREVWEEEMKRISKVPEKGKGSDNDDEDDDDKDTANGPMLPLTGLKAILVSSVSPKQSSKSRSQSGSSTPSQSATQQSGGSRTPMDDMVSIQMIYQAAFCFWLFSFDKEIAAELNNKFDIISVLADVARNAVKEKIVRVIVATFRNLAEKAPNANISAMLGCKCLPLMESLSGRKWSDEEITEDIDAVKELLSEKLKGMR